MAATVGRRSQALSPGTRERPRSGANVRTVPVRRSTGSPGIALTRLMQASNRLPSSKLCFQAKAFWHLQSRTGRMAGLGQSATLWGRHLPTGHVPSLRMETRIQEAGPPAHFPFVYVETRGVNNHSHLDSQGADRAIPMDKAPHSRRLVGTFCSAAPNCRLVTRRAHPPAGLSDQLEQPSASPRDEIQALFKRRTCNGTTLTYTGSTYAGLTY